MKIETGLYQNIKQEHLNYYKIIKMKNEIKDIIIDAHMAGQKSEGVDPSYHEALAYYNNTYVKKNKKFENKKCPRCGDIGGGGVIYTILGYEDCNVCNK